MQDRIEGINQQKAKIAQGRKSGFVPCNDLADAVLKECLSAPGKQLVKVPWATGALNLTGRLNAIAAIGSGNFGVARKTSGSRETFKCYYRRSLTGRAFAEIWGTWKAAIIASPLVYAANDLYSPMKGVLKFDRVAPGEMLAAFIIGVLLTVLFLPRGLLSLGTQMASATTTGRSGQEAGGLLSLTLGLLGFSYALPSLFQEWSLAELFALVSEVADKVVFREEFYATIPLSVGYLAATSLTIGLLAKFIWYLSFRLIAVRGVDAQIRDTVLPLHRRALEGWDTTLHASVVNKPRGPIVALVVLFYVIAVLGTACSPLFSLIASWF